MAAHRSIGVLGTGAYLPKEEITNAEIAARFEVTTEWIERKTMIQCRRYAAPHEATSDLAAKAAEAALDNAGLTAEQVDFLIVSTSTGDHPVPATSCLVQSLIGADRAACFDLSIACSGFVYALEVARALLASRPGTHALVVAADLYSRFIDHDDRSTAVLLGDGAGAAVLGEVAAGGGLRDTDLRGFGSAAELLVIEAGGSRRPASPETVADKAHLLRMRGREVTEFVLGNVPGALTELVARNGLQPAEIDHFIPHQANGVMLGKLAQEAGLSWAQLHLTLPRYGNMGSASVAVTLDDANRSGALRDGDLVLLSGFGGGMAMGNCLLRWTAGGAG
jgi:3-oxoacyl-[acyl-carrier-protein] synthase-3